MTTQIDVIRHGEPVGGRRYRGHGVDDPLSEKGWQQMWKAVADRSDWQHIAARRCLVALILRNSCPKSSKLATA